MNESEFNQLKEASWRRRLHPDEEQRLHAWLAGHPEMAEEWREEAGLNAALNNLPDVPVASNFTALVLQQVDREMTKAERREATVSWWQRLQRGWIPRLAGAAALVLLVGTAGWQYRNFRQQQMAHGMVRFSFAAAAVTEPQVFEDFDAIRRLNPAPPATDDALFIALNQ